MQNSAGNLGVLVGESVEVGVAPFAPVVNIEAYGSAVVLGEPLEALTEVIHVVRGDYADGLGACCGVGFEQGEGHCYVCMAAAAIGAAAVGVVHGGRAVNGQPDEEVSLSQPGKPLCRQQGAVRCYAETRRDNEPLRMFAGVFVAPLQQFPLHEGFAAEKADIGSLSRAFCFVKCDVDGTPGGLSAHGVAVFAPCVAVLAAQGAVVGQAEGAGYDAKHGGVGFSQQSSRKCWPNARRNGWV